MNAPDIKISKKSSQNIEKDKFPIYRGIAGLGHVNAVTRNAVDYKKNDAVSQISCGNKNP